MKPGDMHQHDEPSATEREAAGIIAAAIVYASGALTGIMLTLWVMT